MNAKKMSWDEWVKKATAEIRKTGEGYTSKIYALALRDYYDEGYSPEDAVREDMSYAD